MKAAKITFILIVIVCLIFFVLEGSELGHIARLLPFMGGHPPGIYDVAGLVLIILACWGLARLRRSTTDSPESGLIEEEAEQEPDDEPEDELEDEPEDDEEEQQDS